MPLPASAADTDRLIACPPWRSTLSQRAGDSLNWIKSACGAAEVVPLVAVTNLARPLEKLQQRGLWTVGPAGEAEQELYQQDLTGPTVLIMGAEGKGMRRLTREHCDYLVKLPMAGSVSSLNVSVATGVCLFEAVRQRGSHKL